MLDIEVPNDEPIEWNDSSSSKSSTDATPAKPVDSNENEDPVKCQSVTPTPTPSTSPSAAATVSSSSSSPVPSSPFLYPPIPRSQQYSLIKPSDFQKRPKARALKDLSLLNAVKANYRFIYRINDGVGTTNTMLQKVCEERGWREFREGSLFRPGTTPYERAMRGATGWNLWWSYSIYQFSPYKYLRNWQFTNHNPKGFQFCNKLYLTMYMRKMQVIHGQVFDFYPISYILPEDYLRLSTEHFRRAAESFTQYNHNNLLAEKPAKCTSEPVPTAPKLPGTSSPFYSSSPYSCNYRRPRTPRYRPSTAAKLSQVHASLQDNIRFNPVWISKPIALSQGKGIFLTTDLSTITTDKKSIVQEYITRPLLIGGYKWDVRIYVCVAAVDPLVIYIYNEGLCRFCTEKYSVKDLSRMYSHLTNASLNKLSPAYEDDKDLIGQGCKWSLGRLRQHFKERRIHDWLLWQKVMGMIVLTVIGDSLRLGYSASNRNCFDLFGFDVLVDENLKPWLLECNYSPGLGGDCKTDEIVKIPMLHGLFDLLGFPDKNWYTEIDVSLETTTKKGGGDKKSSSGDASASARYDDSSVIHYDKEDITRQYFDMLLARIKVNSANEEMKRKKSKFTEDTNAKTEMRLNDAKTIYSQNLVVQYLKNQSTGGGGGNKLSKQVRDQLISVAAKKLRSKLTALTSASNVKKEKKGKPLSTVASTSSKGEPEQNPSTKDEDATKSLSGSVDKNNNECSKDADNPNNNDAAGKQKQEPSSQATPTKSSKGSSASSLMSTLKKEFPSADSEAFQKLKYYFDAGIDYPMDAKTGKFKDCPALISVKKDWFNPPKQEGGWIRVYPFDARTVKSPYKSSLSDIKQAVRSIESYLKVAEHLFFENPTESDDFFKRKVKMITRRDTEIWLPPVSSPASTPGATATTKHHSLKQQRSGTSSCTSSSNTKNDSPNQGKHLPITETDVIDSNNNNLLAKPYIWQSSDDMCQ